MSIIKQYILGNGLVINIFDKTFRYFGEYYTVFLELLAEIPVKEGYFDSLIEYNTALKMLGERQNYVRTIRKEGVFQSDLERIKEEIIHNFEKHSLNYLERESFLKKFIAKRFKEEQRKAEIKKLRDKLVE